MTNDEYKKQILIKIKRFIKKRIEVRKIYKELQQIKDNVIYLKKKYRQENTEEFTTEEGKLLISTYKSEFSSRLKKEFKNLSIVEKRKLFKLGLINISFRLNYLKFGKLKESNKETPIDEYVIKRKDIQPYRWNLSLNEKTLSELKEYVKELQERFDLSIADHDEMVDEEVQKALDKIAEDRFKINEVISKEEELIREQLEAMGLETNPEDVTPDVYEAIMNNLVEIDDEDEEEEN